MERKVEKNRGKGRKKERTNWDEKGKKEGKKKKERMNWDEKGEKEEKKRKNELKNRERRKKSGEEREKRKKEKKNKMESEVKSCSWWVPQCVFNYKNFITHHSKIRELSDRNKNWKQKPNILLSRGFHNFWVMSNGNRIMSQTAPKLFGP